MYTSEQTSRYLERIGCHGEVRHDQQTLSDIIHAHLCAVPYENLDVLCGVPIRLDEQALYHTIVEHRRGGYCFELNGALSALLTGLGFEVINLAARMRLDGDAVQTRRHRVLLVRAQDGWYLCDVGLARESQRIALKMEDGLVQSDGVSEYRLGSEPFYGHVLYQKEPGKPWKAVYAFTDEVQAEVD